MRQCPSVEGSAPPLITHRIGVDVCMARQRTFFHKCHRCIYRGQAANWVPEVAPIQVVEMNVAEKLVPEIRLPRTKAKGTNGKPTNGKPTNGKPKAAADKAGARKAAKTADVG